MTSSYTVKNIIEQDNINSTINSYIKILTPIQFTLETCNRANDDKYLNFLMTSPRENTFYSFKTENEINHFNMRPPHIHDFYELLIVLDGEIHQLIEKTDFVFHSGSCCLMNHNIVHKEIFSSDATLLFIGMSKELVQQLSEDEPKVYFPDIERPGHNPILRFLSDNLDNPDTKEYLDFMPSLNNKDWHHTLHAITDNILRAIMFPKLGSTYVIKGMLLELFDYLSNPEHFHFTPVHVEADNDFLLFTHISHILEDTNGRITRSELEQLLNYSGNYLNSIVKKYTNSCLFDYSQTFCMKRAAALLLETTASISEIMDELHFTNTTHFYKCFKEHYHMTPKQYRISMKIKLVP